MTVNTLDEIEAAVFKAAGEVIPGVTITKASALHADLGMDSLDVVEFQIAIEDTLGGVIPDNLVGDHDTIADVIGHIRTLRAG